MNSESILINTRPLLIFPSHRKPRGRETRKFSSKLPPSLPLENRLSLFQSALKNTSYFLMRCDGTQTEGVTHMPVSTLSTLRLPFNGPCFRQALSGSVPRSQPPCVLSVVSKQLEDRQGGPIGRQQGNGQSAQSSKGPTYQPSVGAGSFRCLCLKHQS